MVPISNHDMLFYASYISSQQIKYLPAGVDAQQFNTTSSNINFDTLYFLGGLDWIPNQQGLLWFINHVFDKLLNEFPQLTFHIAGRNAPDWLKKLNKKNIIFYGEVNNANLFAEDKFICIVPLQAGSGMKIKIIEAMALGKPVVTTPVGAEGMPTELQQYFYIAATPPQFVAHIKNIILHKEKYLKLSSEAKYWILNKLDYKLLTRQLHSFYQLVLNK